MAYQTVFRRYELKYVLTIAQKERILSSVTKYMIPDQYGKTTIRNLYFDTDTYLLIRRSIEKPVYKEKLRLRSYSQVSSEDTVFAELKKKFNGVVYKRRLSLAERDAVTWLCGGGESPVNTQISREIDYFRGFYAPLYPTVFLAYDREAYYSDEEDGFRVTFDDSVLARQTDLSLRSEVYGTPILEDGKVLMEIKCSGGIPLWMTELLSAEKLCKTPFSKYGTAYQTLIYSNKINKKENPQYVC
ncbi:MAG: polyphosphate polymerase domain-containing protein [Ruminococcaceae bacterium]|nr:polyphosphate polymerase domain-containing protein [Oscillospiraceae bacterium]